MPRKSKHDIPGPAHELGDPQTARLWDELRTMTTERDRLRERVAHLEEIIAAAHDVCDEFASECAADRHARITDENASLKVRLAKYEDIARAGKRS